ncbi:hypothetical protein DPMN_075721 [Dreissena polymorpha]|uniref:Uncharacterized protein n=1 Tax=Dreissena polymorpha TaxID=45954 RepID=A0A9D4BPQ4_DREPO|nr:hypothetical protein DPMN_075721 [Dreissena polymorpha]
MTVTTIIGPTFYVHCDDVNCDVCSCCVEVRSVRHIQGVADVLAGIRPVDVENQEVGSILPVGMPRVVFGPVHCDVRLSRGITANDQIVAFQTCVLAKI